MLSLDISNPRNINSFRSPFAVAGEKEFELGLAALTAGFAVKPGG